MQIDIREHIKSNFKDVNVDDIRSSIEDAIKEKDEITLPGLGVFFEMLWTNSDESLKKTILNNLKKAI